MSFTFFISPQENGLKDNNLLNGKVISINYLLLFSIIHNSRHSLTNKLIGKIIKLSQIKYSL